MSAGGESSLGGEGAVRAPRGGGSRRTRRFARDPAAVTGALILALFTVVGWAAPSVAPTHYDDQRSARRLRPALSTDQGHRFLLGTDQLGRDELSRLIYAARVSLLVGAVGVLAGALIGTAVGLVAGWYESWAGALLMRTADVQLAFPYLLLAIAVIAFFGPGLGNLVIVLALRSWVVFARSVRASVLATKPLEFVQAALAGGAGAPHVLLRHILPHTMAPITVLSTVEFANLILLEATLSFLGLGVQPPFPSWGMMLSDARAYLLTDWQLSVYPGVAIMLTVMAANLLGDGLRDAFDPRGD